MAEQPTTSTDTPTEPVTPTQPSDSQPEAPTVKSLSGYDDGEVLPDGEIVRGSYDAEGNLTGWHKEPAGSK